MDAGVIGSCKCAHGSRIMQRVIASMNSKQGLPQVNVKDALFLMHSSWAAVTPTTIHNCFQKTGFKAAGVTSESISNAETNLTVHAEEDKVHSLCDTVHQLLKMPEDAILDTFLSTDDDLQTSESRTTEDILSSVIVRDAFHEEESNMEDEAVLIKPKHSCHDALAATSLVRYYLETRPGVPDSILLSPESIDNNLLNMSVSL